MIIMPKYYKKLIPLEFPFCGLFAEFDQGRKMRNTAAIRSIHNTGS